MNEEIVEVEKEIVTNEQLQTLMQDEDEFTNFFKKKAYNLNIGKGEWIIDGKGGFKYTLPDGSFIRAKFFDTVKQILNSKGVIVPGRESYLSYIDISVMPKGRKGYAFISDVCQHVWGFTRSQAEVKHNVSLDKVRSKAEQLGCDLSLTGAWCTHFVNKL